MLQDNATVKMIQNLVSGETPVKKAECDINGNVIHDTYAQKKSLANVAKTGSYNDLIDKPTFVSSLNGKTGDVTLTKEELNLGNVENVRQYSETNPPPYPVTAVNGRTGNIRVCLYVHNVTVTWNHSKSDPTNTTSFTAAVSFRIFNSNPYPMTTKRDLMNLVREGHGDQETHLIPASGVISDYPSETLSARHVIGVYRGPYGVSEDELVFITYSVLVNTNFGLSKRSEAFDTITRSNDDIEPVITDNAYTLVTYSEQLS